MAMKVSVIICSCDRPDMLPKCLATIESEASVYDGVEIVLVHRRDDLPTSEVMQNFARLSRVPVTVCFAERPGLSVARNVGVAHASGDLLFFTDDDCLMKPGHIGAMMAAMDENPIYAYGSGGVHDAVMFPPDVTHLKEKAVIQPYTIISAGTFSGCNMFFRKEVFDKLGGFREDMGAGCGLPFVGAEDLEMTTRANFSGLTGVLVPGAVIIHDHQRKKGSPELKKNLLSYDISRGSFYAYMMMHGIYEIWTFWASTAQPSQKRKMTRESLEVLQREFYGAAEYLAHCLKNNIDVDSPS